MKYAIDIAPAEGTETGCCLPDCWKVDTADPGWRDDLPGPEFFVELIEKHEEDPDDL